MTSGDDARDAARRRAAIAGLVAIVALFVVILVALALGEAVIAAGASALLVVAWFLSRSLARR